MADESLAADLPNGLTRLHVEKLREKFSSEDVLEPRSSNGRTEFICNNRAIFVITNETKLRGAIEPYLGDGNFLLVPPIQRSGPAPERE